LHISIIGRIFSSRTMSPADKKQRMDRFFTAHRESGLPVSDLAGRADGRRNTIIHGAGEQRPKESNRLHGLHKLHELHRVGEFAQAKRTLMDSSTAALFNTSHNERSKYHE
jgi:hypothetical protein